MTVRTARTMLLARILLGGLAALLADHPGRCQTPTPQNTTVNVNYVYAALLGFGGYSLAGLSANVYALPLSDKLTDTPRPGWSLRLLLPVQVGLYNFGATFAGQRISINQQSVTVVPGAELQIPLTDNFAVKPFAQGDPDSGGPLGRC